MSEPDLSGIDPLRVPEVRRRIAALEEYLALPDARTVDAARLADTIGLSRWQFQRLAKIWRDHRDPSMIIAGKRGRSSRDYGIPQRSSEIEQEEIRRAPSDADIPAIAERIEARCREEGLVAPSRRTIWAHVRKDRKARAPEMDAPRRIVVGRMWFHLPVIGSAPGDMPTLLAAVSMPERRILAHRVSIDAGRPPSIAELMEEVAALVRADAEPRTLEMSADDLQAAAPLFARTGLHMPKPHHRAISSELSSAFSGELGPLRAIHRRSAARPAKRKPAARLDRPIEPEEAIAVIEAAIASHNANAPQTGAFALR